MIVASVCLLALSWFGNIGRVERATSTDGLISVLRRSCYQQVAAVVLAGGANMIFCALIPIN